MSLPQPDLGILRKAQRGDERAFSIIVRTYEQPVFNYVLRLTGDRALAEDLTQEVFLRVFQGLPNFSLRSPRSHDGIRQPTPRLRPRRAQRATRRQHAAT